MCRNVIEIGSITRRALATTGLPEKSAGMRCRDLRISFGVHITARRLRHTKGHCEKGHGENEKTPGASITSRRLRHMKSHRENGKAPAEETTLPRPAHGVRR